MLRKDNGKQVSGFDQYYYDKVIPQHHLLRNIAQHIDFSFIRDLLADQYSADYGRPADEAIGSILITIRNDFLEGNESFVRLLFFV